MSLISYGLSLNNRVTDTMFLQLLMIWNWNYTKILFELNLLSEKVREVIRSSSQIPLIQVTVM